MCSCTYRLNTMFSVVTLVVYFQYMVAHVLGFLYSTFSVSKCMWYISYVCSGASLLCLFISKSLYFPMGLFIFSKGNRSCNTLWEQSINTSKKWFASFRWEIGLSDHHKCMVKNIQTYNRSNTSIIPHRSRLHVGWLGRLLNKACV